jgi:hypothetical protein
MKSWDCFDTLIGRLYFNPKSIFYIVANKINDQSFVAKRIDAEKRSTKKTYEDIYSYLPGYDPNVELDTELEYSFPIRHNFDAVSDGDIIVSDMYLNSEQIEKILRYHGLNKNIKIYSSYDGKYTGSIWNNIKSNHSIDYHIGDNLKSDIIQARRSGINSIFFPGKIFTYAENLIKNYSLNLAYLVRMMRLLNPYFQNRSHWIHDNGSFFHLFAAQWLEETNGQINFLKLNKLNNQSITLTNNNIIIDLYQDRAVSNFNQNLYTGQWHRYNSMITERNDHKSFWNDQAQYNIPILVGISKILPQKSKLIFCQRDCLYLQKIYNSINNKNYNMLDVSRASYNQPYNKEYEDYILDITKDCLIVDSHGSGKSSYSFFNKYNIKNKLIHICLHKNYENPLYESIFYDTIFNCNDQNCLGRLFEKFNIPNIGPIINFQNNLIVRDICEHDTFICNVQESCIDLCCKYLKYYSDIEPNKILIEKLLNLMHKSYTNFAVKSIDK